MQNNSNILIVYDNRKFQKPIEYTFHLMMSVLGLEYEIIHIDQLAGNEISDFFLLLSYGWEKPKISVKNHIHIYESVFFGEKYLKKESMPQLPLGRFHNLPVIYKSNKTDDYVKRSKDLLETNIDIIASSFFIVSRYEEIILKDRDLHGRFSAKYSLAYKENFLNRPIVNEYIELLWNWLNYFNINFQRKKIWGNQDFAVCLTHDIDEIYRYKYYPPLGAIFRSIKQKKLKRTSIIFLDYLITKLRLKRDIYCDTFDYIVDLEKKYGFRSSFYFMTSGERYSLNNLCFKKIISNLKEENFEIGIHPDLNTYNRPEILSKEKKELEKITGEKILGTRQHYLKFNISESYKNWESAGLKYDTSLGFADYPGYRCGICHPFKPFDILENRIINLWEIPLTVMDATLFVYCRLYLDEIKKTVRILFKAAEKYNGIFVLLWHNTYMTELFTPEEKLYFENFYKAISKKNCFVGSVKEILDIWQIWQKNKYK
jgi:peptidoglycan/xylan/chitin deacetylase (PgdA/CDA1 family)